MLRLLHMSTHVPPWQPHVEAIAALTHREDLPGIDWNYVKSAKAALVRHTEDERPMATDEAESLLALLDWMQDLAREAKVWPEGTKSLPTGQQLAAVYSND